MSILVLLLVIACSAHAQNTADDPAVLSGPYLGQKPPGTAFKLFAPGIVSTGDVEFGITFSPDGREVFFTRRTGTTGNRIYMMREAEGRWTPAKKAPFFYDCWEFEPNFSPDGNSILYGSKRPLPGTTGLADYQYIWKVRRTPTGWSEPEILSDVIQDIMPMFVTQTRRGDLYLTGYIQPGVFKVFIENGEYTRAERLPEAVNYPENSAHPCIDPEERILVYDSNMDEEGNKNLYISFRNRNGNWSKGKNLTEALSLPGNSSCPHLTFDGKYLFFNIEADIYWIDASVIRSLDPEKRN